MSTLFSRQGKLQIFTFALILVCAIWPKLHAHDLYFGMCDASAALPVDDEHFIVANDEDNVLRVYHIDQKNPVSSIDLSSFFKIEYDDKSPESDIEGAAKLGDYYFFITSHGRDKKGRLRRNRHQFFAVKVDPQTHTITPVGKPFQHLMDHIVKINDLKRLGIYEVYLPKDKRNENLAPKEWGVNIEGLALAPGGRSFYIGFRNPTPDKKALVVELLNPVQVVTGSALPKFGKTFLLDLKNRGIRSFEYHSKLKKYLIVGGSRDGKRNSRLYIWDGNKAVSPEEVNEVDFDQIEDFNPEAISIYEDYNKIQIYSDDGAVLREDGEGGECPCKELPNSQLKYFRGIWINYDALLKTKH